MNHPLHAHLFMLVPPFTALLFSGLSSAQTLQLVSTVSPSRIAPAGGDADSRGPIQSADGRYVLFASTAQNLETLGPLPAGSSMLLPPLNVFLRDRSSNTTSLVSIDSADIGGGDGDSLPLAISDDSRYVLFLSSAGNLVPGHTNKATDVFVRDLATSRTILVSVAMDDGPANGPSIGASMTPDGRYVVFESAASNLVPDDTNGIPDVFVRDLENGKTTLVSVGASDTWAISGSFIGDNEPKITPDGRYVLFHSDATNLVAGVTNLDNFYIRDLVAGNTVQASAGALDAMQQAFGSSWHYPPTTVNACISADGRFVAYEAGGFAGWLVLRYDTQTGITDLISTNATAAGPGNPSMAMTPDGRFIAFIANTNGASGASTCVRVWDAQTGVTTLASGDASGNVQASSTAFFPTFDSSGRFVAFLTDARGLVTNEVVGDYHVYVRDLQSNSTILADADTNGVGSVSAALSIPSLSPDGRFIAFESPDGNLTPNDRNRAIDVFMRDLTSGATEMISDHVPGLTSATANGLSEVWPASASADGRWLVFASEADDIVETDTNGLKDLFARDLQTGTTQIVSADTNGLTANGVSTQAAISADGRYVAFTSSADNLVLNDTNRAPDVFRRDLLTGTTVLVSVGKNHVSSAQGASHSPMISSNGQYVLFRSNAKDLAPLNYAGSDLLLMRDMQAGTTYTLFSGSIVVSSVAMTSNGRLVAFVANSLFSSQKTLYVWDALANTGVYTNQTDGLSAVALSPGGKWLLYWASAGLNVVDLGANTNWLLTSFQKPRRPGLHFDSSERFLVYAASDGQTNPPNLSQIYLYDFESGTNVMISRSRTTAGPGNGNSDGPEISPDARFVAYRSEADDLAPNDYNAAPDVFLYDRLNSSTILVSNNRFGTGSGSGRSFGPAFGGSARLFFESSAPDLVAGDLNETFDVFAFSLDSPGSSLFRLVAHSDSQNCYIQWSLQPGKNYRVQFKNDMRDANWQDAQGSMTLTANSGYFKDPLTGAAQRFYRVIAY